MVKLNWKRVRDDAQEINLIGDNNKTYFFISYNKQTKQTILKFRGENNGNISSCANITEAKELAKKLVHTFEET